MNARLRHPLSVVGSLGPASSALVLGAATGATCVLLAPIAWGLAGRDGVRAEVVAAAVCLAGVAAGWVMGQWPRGAAGEAYRMSMGMLARMGFPLFFGVTLVRQRADLAAGGLAGYLIVFYMVTLLTDAVLRVARIQSQAESRRETHRGT